jgi:hypothetical protein
MYLFYIFPSSSTHVWLRWSNFFNPYKKNSFGGTANGKSQYSYLHQVFIPLNFATIILFTEQGCQRATLNLDDQVPVFMSPSDRVAQLYPQEFGSLFIAIYDTQG